MSYAPGTVTALTAQVQVSVRAQGGTVIGDWSQPASLIMLTAPAGLGGDLTDTDLSITWRAVLSATAYDAQITSGGAMVAAAQPTTETWSVPRANLPADQVLILTVRATTLPNRSPASELRFQIVTAKIAGLTAGYDWNRQNLSVSWPAAAGATSYQITVDGPQGRVADRTGLTTVSAQLPFTAVAGASYTVRVRAVYAIPGVWSDPFYCVAVQA